MRVTVGNLKGGTAKTTTAVYLAMGLSREGRTLLIDADPQGSALDWSEHAEDFPCTVIPWATNDLAKRVAGVAGDYRHIVIDTAPGLDAVLRQALLVTDQLIIPVAPSPMDIRRLPPTFRLAAEVDSLSPVYASVLLTKVRERTRSSVEARDYLSGLDLPVMDAETHLWESYAMSWGSTPKDLGEYQSVLAELKAEVAV